VARELRRAAAPHRWLTSQRILHARQLLEATSASIEEVAAASGFNSAAALRVHFRRTLRTSPLGYRRSFRGGLGDTRSGASTAGLSSRPPAPRDEEAHR
jgi:transcriptional regulator GlxA family with amidase domain